jgi:hypothetical protein
LDALGREQKLAKKAIVAICFASSPQSFTGSETWVVQSIRISVSQPLLIFFLILAFCFLIVTHFRMKLLDNPNLVTCPSSVDSAT